MHRASIGRAAETARLFTYPLDRVHRQAARALAIPENALSIGQAYANDWSADVAYAVPFDVINDRSTSCHTMCDYHRQAARTPAIPVPEDELSIGRAYADDGSTDTHYARLFDVANDCTSPCHTMCDCQQRAARTPAIPVPENELSIGQAPADVPDAVPFAVANDRSTSCHPMCDYHRVPICEASAAAAAAARDGGGGRRRVSVDVHIEGTVKCVSECFGTI